MTTKKPECIQNIEKMMGGFMAPIVDKACYIGLNQKRFDELSKIRGVKTVGAFIRKCGYTYLVNEELDDNQLMLIGRDDSILGIFPIHGKLG